jgi:hypothetical protein
MFFPHADETIRSRVGQRPQQHAVHHGEDGRRRTDSERERQQPGRTESLVALHHRKRVARILQQRVHAETILTGWRP